MWANNPVASKVTTVTTSLCDNSGRSVGESLDLKCNQKKLIQNNIINQILWLGKWKCLARNFKHVSHDSMRHTITKTTTLLRRCQPKQTRHGAAPNGPDGKLPSSEDVVALAVLGVVLDDADKKSRHVGQPRDASIFSANKTVFFPVPSKTGKTSANLFSLKKLNSSFSNSPISDDLMRPGRKDACNSRAVNLHLFHTEELVASCL